MGVLILLGIALVITLSHLLVMIWEEKQEEAEKKKKRILNIRKYVCDGYNDIIDHAERYGNELYASLNDYAIKMDKLSSLKADLKPYDVYAVNRLINGGYKPRLLGRIVIDKNLNPKFMVNAPSLDRDTVDIQLDAAYSCDDVKELAEKCRKIKMDIDIEGYRKEKVKNAINGK